MNDQIEWDIDANLPVFTRDYLQNRTEWIMVLEETRFGWEGPILYVDEEARVGDYAARFPNAIYFFVIVEEA